MSQRGGTLYGSPTIRPESFKNGSRASFRERTLWDAIPRIQTNRHSDRPFTLEESIEKRRRCIRDAADLVGCLTIEFEIELWFRPAVVPVGVLF